MTRSIGRALGAIAIAVAMGCSGDGGGGPAPTIAVTVAPSALTLQQGTSGTVTVNLTRSSFTGPVNVSVTGLPVGVTVGVAPTPLTGATTSATVTVTVGATVAAGVYTATIRAAATGVGEATTTYTLTVTAIPTFALTATPPTVSISQGTTGTTTIGVVRTNFTGAVALTLDAPPAGITGTFNPTPATGDQSVLTVSVASTVATGQYNLNVKGTATGQGDKTVVVTLTVTPPPNFALTATPAAVTISQGAAGTTTIGIARTNFAGGVAFTLDAPPAGITGAFNPTPANGDQSVLTISVALTVAPGNYTLTVKGSGTGPGDKTTTVTLTVTLAPNFALTATPAAVTVAPGLSGTTTIGIVRTNFAGGVALTLDAPPAGITGAFNPTPATGDQSVLTINVAATVADGTYPLTVKGSATGPGDKTTTVTLTVSSIPNYTLTATPAAVTVAPGQAGTTTIGIARTNFAGGVSLTLDAPPAGITGAFNPTPATGTQSVLTINVASTVAVGTYPLTVKGSATGPGDKTTTVTLTVALPPDYTLTTTPTAVTITAGLTGTTTVNIARTNFTGAVTLALDAPPAGITATFNPTAPTGATSAATISVASTVVAGVYTLTIKGTASGVPTAVDSGAAPVDALAPGDRTTTVTVTVLPVPDFAIAATPNAVTVAQGGTGNTTVNVTRTNFLGDIALSLVTPPAGITGVFTPATVTGAVTSSALVISVAGTVAAGVYPVTVQGAATGPGNKTTVVQVTVVTGPTVSLIAAPAALSIEQGASGQSTLTATRTNYTGTIVPSITSGQPAGMTVTFNPNPLTATTSTITVAVAGSVPVGQYNLVITGASGVAGNPTTPLQVNVTAPTGTSMQWQFCELIDAPVKFWRKSGGIWSEVTPTVVGTVTTFNFTISGTNGAVAFTIGSGSVIRSPLLLGKNQSKAKTRVRQALARAQEARNRAGTRRARSSQVVDYTTLAFYGLVGELAGGGDVCLPPVTWTNVHAVLTGLTSADIGLFSIGGYGAALTAAQFGYDVNVAPGTHDWLAIYGPPPAPPIFSQAWFRYNIGRAYTAPGGGDVQLNRTTSSTLTAFNYIFNGGPPSSMYSFNEEFSGARGPILSAQLGSPFGTTNSGSAFFVAPADRLATDMVALTGTSIQSTSTSSSLQTSVHYLGSSPPASGTFQVSQEVPAFTVTPVTGTTNPAWSVTGNTPADYQGAGSNVLAFFTGAGSPNSYTVSATRQWLTLNGFTTTYTLAGEDLPNFNAMWALVGPIAETGVSMFGGLTAAPVAGSTFRSSFRVQMP